MASEDSLLKPFCLASVSEVAAGSALQDSVKDVSGKLEAAGFTVEGTYDITENATVIVVTNAALKEHAAKSAFGAYGACVRVAVKMVKENTVEVRTG
jgi:hypothetical protein